MLGDKYMEIERSGVDYWIRLIDGFWVLGYKFFVDVLFNLICRSVGSNVIGVLLIGMGSDGVMGLFELLNVGCEIFC